MARIYSDAHSEYNSRHQSKRQSFEQGQKKSKGQRSRPEDQKEQMEVNWPHSKRLC